MDNLKVIIGIFHVNLHSWIDILLPDQKIAGSDLCLPSVSDYISLQIQKQIDI